MPFHIQRTHDGKFKWWLTDAGTRKTIAKGLEPYAEKRDCVAAIAVVRMAGCDKIQEEAGEVYGQ